MSFGAFRLTRAVVLTLVLCILATAFISCGGYNSPRGGGGNTSGLTTRALVANLTLPGVSILDYSKDLFATRHPAVGLSNPGFLYLSADKKVTLSFGIIDNTLTALDNATETAATAVTLPGATVSLAVSPDDGTAYAAIPTASVFGQSPGVVQVLTLGSSFAPSLKTTVPIAGVAWIALSPNGNRIVALSSTDPSTVSIVDTSLIGTVPPDQVVHPINDPVHFDHPVFALVSSDSNTAYVLNCGPECGGAQASLTKIDLTTNSVSGSVNLPAATVGVIDGTTMYVAGTNPGSPQCTLPPGTTAGPCGQLTPVDLSAMTAGASVDITDGYHDRIVLTNNTGPKEIFLGSRACTQTPSGTEQRGCLSIVGVGASPSSTFPPDQGDVTGIASIPSRHVVYVTQGGELRIYDTTTNKTQTKQLDIVGQATDVKAID